GYNIEIEQEEAFGWLAGFAYQIPEIALKAAITYRSEIKHKAIGNETFTLQEATTLAPDVIVPAGTIRTLDNVGVSAITPQSENLDRQTGLAANTVAFANVRWVQWNQFALTPTYLKNAFGNNLIDYSDDQWSANVGASRKFINKWTGSASVGYDSAAGNPVTT